MTRGKSVYISGYLADILNECEFITGLSAKQFMSKLLLNYGHEFAQKEKKHQDQIKKKIKEVEKETKQMEYDKNKKYYESQDYWDWAMICRIFKEGKDPQKRAKAKLLFCQIKRFTPFWDWLKNEKKFDNVNYFIKLAQILEIMEVNGETINNETISKIRVDGRIIKKRRQRMINENLGITPPDLTQENIKRYKCWQDKEKDKTYWHEEGICEEDLPMRMEDAEPEKQEDTEETIKSGQDYSQYV